ncbi:hypothetical protein DERP_013754 [Dermatophagoides pteronyssinus]|uniref:Uncharacterized protein n=1 Tax=Dermatophagoides pteronyssinus TaxID=6956 RepID=A0ABQ8JFW7_DERPT|nr:hypothetical protein DERP_013754 [Dermatophagoides pteronyssinus]
MNNVNDVKSIILQGNNQSDTVRFQYKPVYGLSKSLQCNESIYSQFNECEKSSHREWKVTIDEYVL